MMREPKKISIAIDGPAASGKSTTAKLVAKKLNYLHIDTGAMYRAITLKALRETLDADDEQQIVALAQRCSIRLEQAENGNRVFLDGKDCTSDIRLPRITSMVSLVSSYEGVRAILVREQQRISEGGGVVLEGRDIGTVVLPNAELKIFMIADVGERARRRKKQLALAGIEADEKVLAGDIAERDRKDTTRPMSPLRKAKEAIDLDTSNLTVEEQVDFIVAKAQKIINRM
jgi:cytidylate kinase